MKWFDELFKGENNKKNNLTWIIIILALAVIIFTFMNKDIRNGSKDTSPVPSQIITTEETLSYEERLEKRLEETLSRIEGVDRIDVLLTIESSEEKIINKDIPVKESNNLENDGSGGTRSSQERDQDEKTVLLKDPDGTTQPIIVKEIMPVIQGVIILTNNGDDPILKEKLMKAAEILLDIAPHKIGVYKMK